MEAPEQAASGFEIVECPHPMYVAPGRPRLEADDAAAQIAELLRPWGGTLYRWSSDKPRTFGETNDRLAEWRVRGRGGRSTVLVWVGHGGTDQRGNAHLFVSGDPGTSRDIKMSPAQIAAAVWEQCDDRGSGAWTMVIVEACGGSRFVTLVEAHLNTEDQGERVLLIGSGAPRATEFVGRLVADLRRVLGRVTEDVLPLHRLASLLDEEREIDSRERLSIGRVKVGGQLVRVAPGPITAVWSDYRELRQALDGIAADSDTRRSLLHYTTKGTGTDLGEFAWHFVGRDSERREIFDWLRRPEGDRLLVVCGPPGSGKSALLGSVLIDCRPELAAALEKVIGGRDVIAPACPLPDFDVVLHLTGATIRDIAAQIAAHLGGDPGAGVPVNEAHRMLRARATTEAPLRILADALDESVEPVAIAHFFDDLLRRFRAIAIIGTREDAAGAPGLPGALGTSSAAPEKRRTLWLNPSQDDVFRALSVRIRDAELREGVKTLVANAPRPPAGEGAEHQFLWAALAAEEINVRSAGADQRAGLIGEVLGIGHRDLFRRALRRLGEATPLACTALLALAMAHGRGLPRQDRIWEEATSALDPEHRPVTSTEIDEVLDAAGAYVMLDHDHGQGVYRLVHRVLQEQLLEEAEALEDKRLYVFRQLLNHIRPDRVLSPYLRGHLPSHAASASARAWAELADRVDVLDRLDPYALAGAALRSGPVDALPVLIRGTLATAYLARDREGDDRAGLRMLGVALLQGELPRTVPGAAGAWSVRWAMLRQRPAHLPVGNPNPSRGGARALAVVPLSGGRPAIAVASGDTTVSLWDPESGQPTGVIFDLASAQDRPPTGRGVVALTPVEHSGRWWLAGAPVGGSVTVWNPITGERVLTSTPPGAPVDGLAAYQAPDGTARLAIARANGIVRWIPMTGEMDGEPLGASLGAISGLVTTATGAADDVTIVALAQSGAIEAWDARTGRRWSGEARLPAGGVAVALLEASAEEIVLAALDGTGSCYRCVLRRGVEERVVPGRSDLLAELAGGRCLRPVRAPDGRRLLAVADRAGKVCFWDLAVPGVRIAGWRAHRDPVDAVVAASPAAEGGWALATIAKGDGVTRIWPASALDAAPDPGHRQVFWMAATGSRVAVATRDEVTVHDPRTGQRTAEPFVSGRITGLTAAADQRGWTALSTGDTLFYWPDGDLARRRSWRHSVRITGVFGVSGEGGALLMIRDVRGSLHCWDFATGRLRKETVATGSNGSNAAMSCYRDRDGVVVATSYRGEVRLWRYPPGAGAGWRPMPSVCCGKVPLALASADDPNGRLFVVTEDALRGVLSGREEWRIPRMWSVRPAAVTAWRTAEGRLRVAVGERDGEIFVFDGADGRMLREIPTGLRINALRSVKVDQRRCLMIGAMEGAVAIDFYDAAEEHG